VNHEPYSRLSAIIAVCVSAAAVALCALTAASPAVPLGVRHEWTWRRLPIRDCAVGTGVGLWLLLATAALALVGALSARGGRGVSVRWRTVAFLVVLLLVGSLQLGGDFVFRGGPVRWIGVLHSRQINGVFTLASDGGVSSGDLLSDFEGVTRGRGTHITNNPPGLIMAYRALWDFFERHGAVARAVAASQPVSVRRELSSIGSKDRCAASPAAGATLWTVAVVSRAMAIAVVLPVVWLAAMRLARGDHHAERDGYGGLALLAGTLAGLTPAAMLFAPRQDSVYPTLAALIVALVCRAFERRWPLAAAAAGLLVWLGMFVSLAFAVVAAIAGLFAALEWLQAGAPARPGEAAGVLLSQAPNGGRRMRWMVLPGGLRPGAPGLATVGFAVGGWLVAPLVLYLGWRCNIFAIWRYNLAEHSAFYLANPRTYESWLWINPLEFVVAMGLPVAVFAAWRVAGELRRFLAGNSFDALALSWAGILVALDVSGLNMGEVARLWLPFMPFGGVLAAQAVGEFEPRLRGWCAGLLVLLQAASCVLLGRYVRVMW